MQILSRFESWVQEERSILENSGYRLEVTRLSSGSNSALRVDLDSEEYIARITMWESGDCQAEVIDVLSEHIILDEYLKFSSNTNINDILKKFLHQLKLVQD